MEVAVDGGHRGKAAQAFGDVMAIDQLSAEPELLAERMSGSVGLVGASSAHRYGQPFDLIEARLDAAFFDAARARCGAKAWDAAAREGGSLPFDDAIANALHDPPA